MSLSAQETRECILGHIPQWNIIPNHDNYRSKLFLSHQTLFHGNNSSIRYIGFSLLVTSHMTTLPDIPSIKFDFKNSPESYGLQVFLISFFIYNASNLSIFLSALWEKYNMDVRTITNIWHLLQCSYFIKTK